MVKTKKFSKKYKRDKSVLFDVPEYMKNDDGETVKLTPLERKVLMAIRETSTFDEQYYPKSKSYGFTWFHYIEGMEGVSKHGLPGVIGSLVKKKMLYASGDEPAGKHGDPSYSELHPRVDVGPRIYWDEKKKDHFTYEWEKGPDKNGNYLKTYKKSITLKKNNEITKKRKPVKKKITPKKSSGGKYRETRFLQGHTLKLISEKSYTEAQSKKMVKDAKKKGLKYTRFKRASGYILYKRIK